MTRNPIARAALAIALGLALPQAAEANSNYVTGGGSLTATGNLDFKIVIPQYLYVRIGTGTATADNTTIDNIVFTVPAASVGSGTAVAGTGGDLAAGKVTARVMANVGAVSFSSTTTGALDNGAGDTISFAEIGVAVASNTSATALAHPAFVDGGTTSISLPTLGSSKVTNLDAKWTFTYLNSAAVAAGTYGGVNTQNSRVAYTAAMP